MYARERFCDKHLKGSLSLNQFVPNAPFLYALKHEKTVREEKGLLGTIMLVKFLRGVRLTPYRLSFRKRCNKIALLLLDHTFYDIQNFFLKISRS